ncbi:hypothetical protein JRQ81_014861 [Phrynocephalus forsythii]|uniref:Maestro heat-like repeat-containing protein family member 7 n=1 Tax=Phrynocephalus forsythii TaxID=171643 RepID=A0A9Q0XYH0_9SAUR|nr:hypothetical protein JRQ81_014861 [Phrynocephalus forsythii]
MEEKSKKLVSKHKDSAELLNQPWPLKTTQEESERSPPYTMQERNGSQAISEGTSWKVHGEVPHDTEVEIENLDSGSEMEDYNKGRQIGPQELGSKTSGNNNHKFCCQNQKLLFVEQIMTQIADLPMDHIDSHTTSLRCQGMILIEDLSQVKSSLWLKDKLLSISIASIFALPSIDTLQRQAGEKVNVQALYDQIVEAMETMLKCLLSKNPNATELFALLDHLAPWMTSGQAHERARAVNAYVCLLKFAATFSMFQMSPEFPKLGCLLGQLCLRLSDPRKEIGQQAMEGIHFLYSLMQSQKGLEKKNDFRETEQDQMYKEILGTYSVIRPHENISRIIKEFEPHLTSRQMAELLLTAIGCLKEANKHTTAASHAITTAIMECYKHKLQEQVPEIVDQVHQQLGSIYEFRDRQIMMRVVSQLAHSYMPEVCGALLQCPFPMSRFSAELWCMLTKSCSDYELTVMVKVLLKELQLSPKATGNYITPLAAASAFCKLLSMPRCSDVALYIYPQLLMALLVQVHYHIRHNSGFEEEYDPARYLVTALKTLLLAVRCHYEFTLIEKQGGWELLTSCEDHHRGVRLLARAMLQRSYYFDLQRILYLLVPFLERGDEEHQITATAFFIELLCMPEARRLPEQYSLHRMKRGLMNENPVIRALCVKGLINMADWPGKDMKPLLPAMTKTLSGMDGRLFVETVAEMDKLLTSTDEAHCIWNITLSLQELFSDKREDVRGSAICLFGKMVNLAKKNHKPTIRQQVLENVVPLLLHLQEENCDIAQKSKYAIEESFHFLGWKPPKHVVSGKVWHEHEEVLDEICHYLVQTQQGNLQRFLYQTLFYTESPLCPIKRAAIMLLGFLVLHMDSMVGKEDLDMILQTLEGLMHDPDAPVCIAAAHAHDRVFAVLSRWKKRGDIPIEKPTKNSRSPNDLRGSSSSLFRVISLWKSVNRN